MIINMFNGFCMAVADSVPGVSGGTIAFILGFYEELLESINNITSGKKEDRKESIFFLTKLFAGWIIGMTCSVLFLSKMFEKNIYTLSSLFIGLTVASIIYILKNEIKMIQKNNSDILLTILGILLVVIISSFRGKFVRSGTLILSNLDFAEYMYIFISGMITVSAMVLPGISGSTLLLILGAYIPIINALDRLLNMDFSVLSGLLTFIAGVLVGIVLSVRVIRNAFRRHRSKMIYFVIGLTIGSLHAIKNGPMTMNASKEALNFSNFSIVGFLVGVVLLLILEFIKKNSIKRKYQK